LESGAPIEEINCVRKHLSLIKGGRLSAAAYPRPVLALIISDVVGDDLATVGSGPTVPDPSTFAEAVDICFRCHILDRLPPSVRSYLLMPLPGRESPKPGDKIFSTTRNALIGSATDSWKAIGGYAKALGIHAELVSAKMSGEARTWGRDLAERELPKRLQERREGLFVFTGELTVTIGGHGVGGRNQEMLLAFAIAAKEKDLVKHEWSICALAMDGLEGNSPAMGAALSSACLLSLKEEEIEEAKQALDDNDSHSFWKKRNMCILTGETGTNVNDIVLLYVKP
jgi:glycerate 2-kinase